MIGTQIGNYRIVSQLGGGAMGEVFLAEHTVMGRRAAIKIIRDELSTDAECVQRFINEARLVNRIGHPNIVEITDFGQVGARYYIMMELLEGETLEQRLELVGTMSEANATHIALQVADALRAAHELGVVHRDLKPENIYLAQRPRGEVVKVLDFGIAKLMHGPLKAATATSPGAILGTPQYMSPEQSQGDEHLDHRSDVYSLGVVLYRMLTGAVPFRGDSIVQILSAHISEVPPPPRLIRADLSLRIEALVLKALEKPPERRFPDMAAMRAALEGKEVARPPAKQIEPAQKAELAQKAEPAQKPQAAQKAEAAQKPDAAKKPDAAQKAEPAQKPEAAQRKGEQTSDAGAGSPTDEQRRRVSARLAQILVERIQKGKLRLPAMPLAARECLRLLEAPQYQVAKVASAIGRDPVIAPQVMRRARSALIGRGNQVKTIEQAVARLGARELRELLLDMSARRLFESKNAAIRKLTKNLWEHSVAVAVLARALAQRRRDLDPEVAYLAGLLHDVGKPIAAAGLLEAERAADDAKAWLGSDTWLAVINQCHREVGVALARSWELHEDVLLAIARSDRYTTDNPSSPASVVCFANALAKQAGVCAGAVDKIINDALVREGRQLFKLDDKAVESLIAALRGPDANAATLFE